MTNQRIDIYLLIIIFLYKLKTAVIHKISHCIVLEKVLTTLKQVHSIISSLATIIRNLDAPAVIPHRDEDSSVSVWPRHPREHLLRVPGTRDVAQGKAGEMLHKIIFVGGGKC